MKKRYRILVASTTTQLADRVNDALAEGAYLIGGPVLDPHGTISQAVLERHNPPQRPVGDERPATAQETLTNDAMGHVVRRFTDPENTLA